MAVLPHEEFESRGYTHEEAVEMAHGYGSADHARCQGAAADHPRGAAAEVEGEVGCGDASAQTQDLMPPLPPFGGEPEIRLRSAREGGHRVHDPGGGQLAVGLAVGVIDADSVLFDVQAQRGGRIGRERSGTSSGILPRAWCGANLDCPTPRAERPVGARRAFRCPQPLQHGDLTNIDNRPIPPPGRTV